MLDLLKEKKDREIQIDRIMTRLFEIWRKYPDLKFNQLVYYINSAGDVFEPDFFFITDEEFEEDMERATSTGGQLNRGEEEV